MNKMKLIWRIFSWYLGIILLSLFLITWYSSQSIDKFYKEQTISDLEAKAYLLKNLISPSFSPLDYASIDSLCKKISKESSIRITVILPSGEVIGDSDKIPTLMDNHKNRPEVLTAISGKTGSSTRYSNTMKKEMVYVAIPIIASQQSVGIIRTSMPLIYLEKALNQVYLKIAYIGLIIALIAGLLSYKIAREITYPLEQLENGAKNFAQGNLKERLPIFNIKEMGNLARTMNEMAEQLDARIKEIVGKNKEQEIILSVMQEGIIVINPKGQIIKSNEAASRLLNIDLEDFYGRKVKKIAENTDFLDNFLEEAIINNEKMEDTLVLHKHKEQTIQVYSTPIYNEKNIKIGTLVVLNDITKIKKLENIRRDFVANVSHELRTPITSINGFVETLLDGGLKKTKDAEQYLNIIKKHADRLNAIIEDLLSLSRLEQESGKETISLENNFIKNILESAIQACKIKAQSKHINVNLNCPEDIQAKVNPSLLEQAVLNLVDNAINHSNNSTNIQIEALQMPQEVVIKVADQGIGIKKEHLTRIFERFYRVDKARSNKMGETGLGLSIVKHIAQVHGGNVKVTSTVGVGSTFYLSIPNG